MGGSEWTGGGVENLGQVEPAEFHDMISFIWGTFRGPIWLGWNGGTCGIPCNSGEIKKNPRFRPAHYGQGETTEHVEF